jgi:trans-aconitate methyltransferase
MNFEDKLKAILINNSQTKDGDSLSKNDSCFTDKAGYHAHKHFYPQQLKYLADKNEEDINILEIGMANGGSMKCWMEMFPNANFYGIDYNLSNLHESIRKAPNLICSQCSQSDPILKNLFPGVLFDLVIDDASHQSNDQMTSFAYLRDRLTPTGKYIIEDVYPENVYPDDFKSLFDIYDITHIKNRGDDILFVYPKQQ